jgi:hypothetical protein
MVLLEDTFPLRTVMKSEANYIHGRLGTQRAQETSREVLNQKKRSDKALRVNQKGFRWVGSGRQGEGALEGQGVGGGGRSSRATSSTQVSSSKIPLR